MGERPIIFSTPMVRALLDGRKTMTRRLALSPHAGKYSPGTGICVIDGHRYRPSPWQRVAPGDRLWVRENLKQRPMENFLTGEPLPNAVVAAYVADDEGVVNEHEFNLCPWWKGDGGLPSIHMPRRVSRLTLTVADVWVERLQEISEEHARAEGIRLMRDGGGTFVGREGPGNLVTPWLTAKEAFADLWDSLHGDGAWARNPAVVALSFSVERRNIDQEAT